MADQWPISKISLRSARLLRGLTIEEVSLLINISERRLSKYERNNGCTPLEIAIVLMNLYAIPVSALDYLDFDCCV